MNGSSQGKPRHLGGFKEGGGGVGVEGAQQNKRPTVRRRRNQHNKGRAKMKNKTCIQLDLKIGFIHRKDIIHAIYLNIGIHTQKNIG